MRWFTKSYITRPLKQHNLVYSADFHLSKFHITRRCFRDYTVNIKNIHITTHVVCYVWCNPKFYISHCFPLNVQIMLTSKDIKITYKNIWGYVCHGISVNAYFYVTCFCIFLITNQKHGLAHTAKSTAIFPIPYPYSAHMVYGWPLI